MRLIHENDFCRDVAIWYDEFLTPGEDFNETIQTFLAKCSVFVMAVTPQLLAPSADGKQDNYIVQTEYPMARQAGKPVLPVEMAETSDALLHQKFRDLPPRTKGSSKAALSDALAAALTQVALRKNKSPVHDFFIGLAYLKGIDVEVDHQNAVALIQSAANANVLQAVETMVRLHGTGTGVERSTEKMQLWQERLVQLRQSQYDASLDREQRLSLLEDIQALQQLHEFSGNTAQAAALAQQLMQTASRILAENPCPEANRYLCAGAVYMGQLFSLSGRKQEAHRLFSDSVTILRQTLAGEGITLTDDEIRMPPKTRPLHMHLLQDYCTSLCNLGDASLALAESSGDSRLQQEAFRLFEQCYKYLKHPVIENNYPGYRAKLSTACSRMGAMEQAQNNFPAARDWHQKSAILDIRAILEIQQNRDFDAFDALARSLYAYATVDPGKPDARLLHAALEIWELLSFLLPESPQYRECYEELKPYAEFWITKAKKENPHIKYALLSGVYPIGDISTVLKMLRELKAQTVQTRKDREDFAVLQTTVLRSPTAENQYKLANMYFKGIGTGVDRKKALKYAENAAAQDHLPAMELAAELLQTVNPAEADSYRKKAESLREKQRQEEMRKQQAEEALQRKQIQQQKAEEALQRKQILQQKVEEALRKEPMWLTNLTAEANAGSGKACLELADYYSKNHNPTHALQWIETAVRLDYAPAYMQAAYRYRSSGDYKKARYYAKLAIRNQDRLGYWFMINSAKTHRNFLGVWYWKRRLAHMKKREKWQRRRRLRKARW